MYAVILSSFIYLGAFLYPTYLYANIFVWIVPLVVTDVGYGFSTGYVWGLIFFGGHTSWFAYTLATKGQGDARMLVYCAAVCYFSLYSGFWLWCKQQLVYRYVHKIKNHNRKCVALCCTWVISTVTFIYLTCYCSLAIFDCFEGYPFINPLLPVVSFPWYLRAIPYFGVVGYWIIIVLINLVVAKLYNKLDIKPLIFFMILIGFPTLFQPQLQNKIINKDEMVYLQPVWNDDNLTQAQTFYAIGKQLDALAMNNPTIKFVLIPESGFAYNLLDWEDKLGAWTSLFSDTTSIFIGSHRYQEGKKFNSLYQIQDGKILHWYDKSHLVPFVERIPWICKDIPAFHSFFTHQNAVFSYPCAKHRMMGDFQPMICSELFCQARKPIGKTVLFICNDSWFGLNYAKELALRCVKLYSMQYQVPVIFVGSDRCEIIQDMI